jgi:hypothetical protein
MPVSIVQEAGWAPGPVWTGAENLTPTGIRSPDCPARRKSLYIPTTLSGHAYLISRVRATCLLSFIPLYFNLTNNINKTVKIIKVVERWVNQSFENDFCSRLQGNANPILVILSCCVHEWV